ncbi:MAG: hypothetical protein DHS20C18_46640 [Saprospiraceae bacterium]|nr:MAG: hypothetical protein DHS20C18_46640 [Saprospiraceae bacterium]
MDTQKWTTQIDRNTEAFLREFGQLTPAQLNSKPNAQTWSIAQNVDHIMTINATYFEVIKQIRAKQYSTPWIGNFSMFTNFLGKFILKSVQPDRKNKIKTFPVWEPASSELDEDILEQFKQHQEELKKMIERSSDLLDKGVIISSPANRMIVYKLEAAFDIIVAHEQRHFEQAKEVSANL